MLLMIWISLYLIGHVYNFVLQDTPNVLFKHSADYTIDLVIKAEDYEMIHKNELKDFKVDSRGHGLNDLDKIAKMAYEAIKSRKTTSSRKDNRRILEVTVIKSSMPSVVDSVPDASTHAINKRDISNHIKADYNNYNDLINEYFEETDNEFNSNKTYHVVGSDVAEHGLIKPLKTIISLKTKTNNCTDFSIGLQAINCLLMDYRSQRHFTKAAAKRVYRIIEIWFLVYLAVALPLWCTRGWCCCCLFCKFFKPRQTIEEAKKYVLLNPPGVYKTKTGEVRYEPTEREKESYEEFEHFIKTL